MPTPAIIIPIRPTSLRDAKRLIARAEKVADIVEIWLDRVNPLDEMTIEAVIHLAKKPVYVNLKDAAEKGEFAGSAKARVALLAAAAKAGARYVDLPITLSPTLIRSFKTTHKKTKLVLSWHDFDAMPDLKKLRTLAKKADVLGADVVKLVGTATVVSDAFPILAIARELATQKKSFLTMAMGESGQLTRVLTSMMGGLGMFAALDAASASAPGQMSAKELRKWWTDFA